MVSIDTLCWEFSVLQMEENIIVAGPLVCTSNEFIAVTVTRS